MVQSQTNVVNGDGGSYEPNRFSRPPQVQSLSLDDAQAPKDIESLQVICHVDVTSIKFDRHGSLNITLVIPSEFAELGLNMRFLAGFPLSADFQKWRVLVESEDE